MVVRPFSHIKKDELTEDDVVQIILECRKKFQIQYSILIGIVNFFF